MAFTKLTANVNNIQALNDRPNANTGLTADQVKAAFDQAGSDIKDYINNTLTPQLDSNSGVNLGIVNVMSYNASGLATTATGSITTGTKILTLTTTPDFVQGQGINLRGVFEVASLQITAPASASANCTVTLNGVAYTVALVSGDTAIQVATKIRAATYSGWTAGGTAGTDTVTFTSNTTGTKTDASYTVGTTGATGGISTTTQGTADQISTVSSVSGYVVTIADNSTRTITAGTILHDDTAAFNATFAAFPSGAKIIIPEGTFLLSSTLNPPSNFTFLGRGFGKTVLKDGSGLGANRLFYIQGTSGTHKENISFEGICFQNGTAQTGAYTVGKDAIRFEYVDNIAINKCKFTEIEGVDCTSFKYCTSIRVKDNEYYRWTYAALTILIECESIWVEGNKFDTVVSTNYTPSYAISTGHETLGEGTFSVKNLWVERNVVKNNPRWEGIDCHGGENIYIRENYIENVRIGISVGIVTGYVPSPICKNVFIEDNTIIQGTGQDGDYGIVFKGASNGTIQAQKAKISGNKLYGFGGMPAPATGSGNTVGAITVYYASYIKIKDNEIYEYAQAGVMIYSNSRNVDVNGNKFLNCRNGFTSALNAAIAIRDNNIYDLRIEKNRCDCDDVAKAPQYFIYTGSAIHCQINDNTVTYVLNTTYGQTGTKLPIDQSVIPTTGLIQKYGDVIYNLTGKVQWWVSAPKLGYGSLDSAVKGTLTIASGSNIATFVTGDWKVFPEGMNIVIVGAGAAGVDLNAMVLKNNITTLTLNLNASTSVTAANTTYKALTLVT